MARKRLLLVDASNIIHRAWHAYPPTLTTADGEPINALYGFTKILMAVIDRLKPDYICVVMDSDNKLGWRRKLDPDYKFRRGGHTEALTGQFQYIPEAVRALGLPSDQCDGYEADDIIAAYCHKYRNKNLEIMIVSGDKDFMQLFTQSNVVVYDDMKKKAYGPSDTMDKFFVPPHQVTMVQALAGDKIDDIVNLKGFGYKTAAQFIGSHKSFKELFAALKELRAADELIKAKTKKQFKPKHAAILAARKRIVLNHKLVCLAKDAPLRHTLKKLAYKAPNPKKLNKFLTKFQFKSLMGADDGIRVTKRAGKPERKKPAAPTGPNLWEVAKSQKK